MSTRSDTIGQAISDALGSGSDQYAAARVTTWQAVARALEPYLAQQWVQITVDPSGGSGYAADPFTIVWLSDGGTPPLPIAIWIKTGVADTAWTELWSTTGSSSTDGFQTAFAVDFRSLDLYTLDEARDYVMGGVTYRISYPIDPLLGPTHVGGGAGVLMGAAAFYSHYPTLSLLWENMTDTLRLSTVSELWIWAEVGTEHGMARLGFGTIPVDLSSPLTYEAILATVQGGSDYTVSGGIANEAGLLYTPLSATIPRDTGYQVIGIRVRSSGLAEIYSGGDITASSAVLRAASVKRATLLASPSDVWATEASMWAGSTPLGISMSHTPDGAWTFTEHSAVEFRRLRVDYAA